MKPREKPVQTVTGGQSIGSRVFVGKHEKPDIFRDVGRK